MKEIPTAERLENAIKNSPDRYIAFRNQHKQLVEVQDKDSGRVWKKVNQGWIWIE